MDSHVDPDDLQRFEDLLDPLSNENVEWTQDPIDKIATKKNKKTFLYCEWMCPEKLKQNKDKFYVLFLYELWLHYRFPSLLSGI